MCILVNFHNCKLVRSDLCGVSQPRTLDIVQKKQHENYAIIIDLSFFKSSLNLKVRNLQILNVKFFALSRQKTYFGWDVHVKVYFVFLLTMDGSMLSDIFCIIFRFFTGLTSYTFHSGYLLFYMVHIFGNGLQDPVQYFCWRKQQDLKHFDWSGMEKHS